MNNGNNDGPVRKQRSQKKKKKKKVSKLINKANRADNFADEWQFTEENPPPEI